MYDSTFLAEPTFPTDWECAPEAPTIVPNEETNSEKTQEETYALDQRYASNHGNLTYTRTDAFEPVQKMGTFVDDSIYSPADSLEEFEIIRMSIDDDDSDHVSQFADFHMSIDDDDSDDVSHAADSESNMNAAIQLPFESLPYEERYQATLKKLAESMERSQETRKSLTMAATYQKSKSLLGVLSSIQNSSQKLNLYFKNIERC